MLKYSRIHLHETLVEWTDNLELVENYTSAEIRQCLKGETAIVQGKRATLLHKRRSLQECGDQDDSDYYLSQTLQQSDSKGENGDTTRVFKMTFGAWSVDTQKPSSSSYHRSRKKHEHSLKLLRCSISHYFCVKHHFYCVPYAQTWPEGMHAPTDGYQADESDTNDIYIEACGDTEDSEVHRGYMELLIRKLYENQSKFGSLKSQKFKVKTCAGGGNGGYDPPDRQESNRRSRQKTRKKGMREFASLGGNGKNGSETSSSGKKGPADKLKFRPPEEEEEEQETSTPSEELEYKRMNLDNDDSSRWRWRKRAAEDNYSRTSLASSGIGSPRKSPAPSMQRLGLSSSVSEAKSISPPSPLLTPSRTPPSSTPPSSTPPPPPLLPPPEEKKVTINEPVEVKSLSVTFSIGHFGRSEMSVYSQGTKGLINLKNKRFPRISQTYQTVVNSVTQVEKWRCEKGNEWLRLPKQDPDAKKSSVEAWDLVDSTPPQTIEPEVQKFMLCQRWLVIAMTIFGVYPYKHEVTSSNYVRVIWAKHSLNVICLFLSTVMTGFFVVCILWSIIKSFQVTHQPTQVQSIFYIEFQKYMVEGLEVMLGLIFLTIWGATVLSEMGRQQAEFMTRLFYSISLLKYTVSDKISDLIKKRVCILGTMIGITGLLVLFGGNVIPTPREACGFIALLIMSPMEDRIRAQKHFRVMEILGYFVFVWVHTSMSLVLLHLMVVARALRNMARNFNLRLAYRLGQISLDKLDSLEANVVRNIPFQKLYAERLVISSLIKQMGYAHLVAINLYICIAGAEMILFLYGNSRYFNSTLMDVNASFDATLYKLPHPLRMGERGSEIIFKNLTYIFHFMYITYLVLNGLNQTGYVFGLGKNYIRKHGLVHCKSANERRFIMSMLTLDNPKISNFIGVRIPMNRIFIIGMIAVVAFFWALTTAYSPDRLSKQEYTVCDEDGVCTIISLPRGSGVRSPIIYVLPPERPKEIIPIRPNLTSNTPSYWFSNETYPYALGIREGSIPPFRTFHSIHYATSWSKKYYSSTVSIPNIFKGHRINGTVYYELLTRQLRNSTGGVIHPLGRGLGVNIYMGEKVQNETRKNVRYYTGDVTQQLTGDEWDDCGNPSAPFFVREGGVYRMKPPNITLMSTNFLPGGDPLGREMFLCCYEYWREDGTLGESTCNMPSLDVLHANCHETTDVKGQHFANILRLWRYETSQSHLNIDPLEVAWVKQAFTHCICRGRYNKKSPGGSDSLCKPGEISLPPSTGCKQIFDTSKKRIDGTMRLTQPMYSWDLSYGYTFIPHMYRVHQNDDDRQFLYTPYTRDLWHMSSRFKNFYDVKVITNFAKQGVDFATCQYGRMAKVHPKLLDDCGNPPVDSLNNVTNTWNLSPLLLIYKGRYNLNFICCYNYSNSDVAIENCNVPPGRFVGNCERDDAIPKRYDARLTQYKSNMQKRGILFDLRVNTTVTNVWKKCICRKRVTFDEKKQQKADEKCNKLFEDSISK